MRRGFRDGRNPQGWRNGRERTRGEQDWREARERTRTEDDWREGRNRDQRGDRGDDYGHRGDLREKLRNQRDRFVPGHGDSGEK